MHIFATAMTTSSRAVLLVFLLPVISAAAASAPPAIPPEEACRSSSSPGYCRTLLSPVKSPSILFDYGYYSVAQALKQAKLSAASLRRYIVDAGGNASRSAEDPVPRTSLEICGSLAGLTVGYLASAQEELGRGKAGMTGEGAARVRSLMSSVVTNQVTCSDMLVEDNGVGYPPQLPEELDSSTRLYGVALDLVTASIEGIDGGSEFFKNYGSVPVKKTLTVSQDGKGDFATLKEAVKAAARNKSRGDADAYIVIQVGEGTYKEHVVVSGSKNKLMFVGAGINKTVIVSTRSTKLYGHKTFDTGVFTVEKLEKVIVKRMTFVNKAGPGKFQAAAVRISADLTVFHDCSFMGYQDTLYIHSGRQFYRNCDIYGTIDFIFGDSTTVLQRSRIIVRLPRAGQFNVVTAQGRTMKSATTGISIHECEILPTPDMEDAMRKGKAPRTFLGRPWKEYSRTVVMQSQISGMVDKEGWTVWKGDMYLSTLYYGEYDNDGDGASTAGRVNWPGYRMLSTGEADQFTVKNFLKAVDWLEAMSIPNDAGLR